MSTRVQLLIKNNTGTTVTCTDIACEGFDDLNVGDTLENGGQKTYTSSSNDRIFCTFEQVAPGKGAWQLGVTCPKSSHNSAQGSFDAGLQTYERTGTPVTFTYDFGNPNQADWNNGDKDTGASVPYGDCS